MIIHDTEKCLPLSFSTYRFPFSNFIPPPTPAMNSWVLSVSPFQLRKSGNQPQGWMDVLPRKHPRSFPENEWLVQMVFPIETFVPFVGFFRILKPHLATLQNSTVSNSAVSKNCFRKSSDNLTCPELSEKLGCSP